MMVDTLKIARELRAAELPAEQAEAIAAAIGRSVSETAATKADLEAVRIALKGDVDSLRHELKGDIDSLRHEMGGSTEKLRAELERAHNKLLTWIMSAMVALGGIIIAVVKL